MNLAAPVSGCRGVRGCDVMNLAAPVSGCRGVRGCDVMKLAVGQWLSGCPRM